ncbi:peptidase M76 [Syncephalis fuscata]|nr:peptidase M76 [Syncephalis fuscata]
MQEHECTSALAEIVESPRVRHLLARIYFENRDSLRRGVTCRVCRNTTRDNNSIAYYDSNYQRVVICSDKVKDRREVEGALVHELVHAYDAKQYSTTSCYALACGEVRASLRGECSYMPSRHEQRICALRHATESTRQHCPNAEQIVAQIFDECASQTL